MVREIGLGLVTVLFFVGFFTLTAIAIAFTTRKQIRDCYIIFLLVLIIVPGISGRWLWPFVNWHLYAYRASTILSYYEIRIADKNNREIKYDARAVPPSLATPLRRFARKIPDFSPHDSQEFASFLLRSASLYRKQLEKGSFGLGQMIKFPPHQIGFRWTQDDLRSYQQFVDIRIYRVDAKFSGDGRELVQKSEMLVEVYR